jgi:hypothetical protein
VPALRIGVIQLELVLQYLSNGYGETPRMVGFWVLEPHSTKTALKSRPEAMLEIQTGLMIICSPWSRSSSGEDDWIVRLQGRCGCWRGSYWSRGAT